MQDFGRAALPMRSRVAALDFFHSGSSYGLRAQVLARFTFSQNAAELLR
jgi:hypothetical protein